MAKYENKKYTPTLLYFKDRGHLPEYPDTFIYDLPTDLAPDAQSILLFAYLTTHNEGLFQRGYFIFSTKEEDGTEYKMYMNFSTGLGVTMSSSNIWLPVTPERKLYIELKFADSAEKKKSIAYKEGLVKGCPFRGEWSQVFINGYN